MSNKTNKINYKSMNSRSDLEISKAFAHYIPRDVLDNIMLCTDSYKLVHWQMYRTLNITKIYSYLEARDGKTEFSHTVWFGIHHILKQINSSIASIDKLMLFTEHFTNAHFSRTGLFNKEMWWAVHDLGYLPLIIKSAKEGSVVNVGNVLLTIENTDGPHVGRSGTVYDKKIFAPLVNHMESHLLQVWYPSTVATMSRSVKDIMIDNIKTTYNEKASDFIIKEVVPYLLHDFGLRGAAHMMSAAIGGLAHLVNFIGTDTVPGILLGIQDYGVSSMPGFSVVANEHSIATSYGMDEGVREFIPQHLIQKKGDTIDEDNIDRMIDNIDTFLSKYSTYMMVEEDGYVMKEDIHGIDNMNEFYVIRKLIEENPLGIISLVLDSFNIFVSVAYICRNLKQCVSFRLIEGLKQGIPVNKIVIRPDSQEPEEVLPIIIKIIEKYLGKTNDNINTMIHRKGGENEGFFTLPDSIGLLWGDGMTPKTVNKLYVNARMGWSDQGYTRVDKYSAANFIVGMGGGLLQKHNRDSQRFAFKCAANKFEGSDEWIDIQKNPIGRTVAGVVDRTEHKTSKKGLLKLIFDSDKNEYKTVPLYTEGVDHLITIFENGIMYPDGDIPTLDGIRDYIRTQPTIKM